MNQIENGPKDVQSVSLKFLATSDRNEQFSSLNQRLSTSVPRNFISTSLKNISHRREIR